MAGARAYAGPRTHFNSSLQSYWKVTNMLHYATFWRADFLHYVLTMVFIT